MKKSLLLLASLVMSIGAFAQWAKPIPQGVELTMGDTLYLYNVEAGGFLMGANDWGTRASVSAGQGNKIIIKAVPDDEEGAVMICDSVLTGNQKGKIDALDCQGFDQIWVDGTEGGSNKRPGYDSWFITKTDKHYTITNANAEGNFGVAEFTNTGDQGAPVANNRTFMYQADKTFSYEVEGETIEVPYFAGKFYDKWIFVAPVEYDALIPQLSVYEAAMKLKDAIDAVKAQDANYNTKNLDAVFNNTSSTIEQLDAARAIANAIVPLSKALADAKKEYPNLDFSAPTAVYNNLDATEEELKAAEKQVTAIINEYLSNQATFDNPMDFVDVIGDGSSVDPWTRDFTGEGTTGSHATNTWSTEANNGADGTDMTTPFCEHWTGSGGILSDQKIYQVLTNALPGLYKLTIDARVYSEAGKLDKFEGVSMYFGDESIDLQEQTPITYSGSKSVLWSPDYFTIVAIVKEAQDIEFGFNIKDANFNWIAFKNVSLLYYGNKDVEENAMKLLGQTTELEKVDEDTPAMAEYIKAYNDAVDAYSKAKTADEAKAAMETAKSAKVILDANIAAYENLFEKIEEWEENVAEHNDLTGDEWDNFADFVQAEDDIEGYPSPSVGAIKNEGTYTLTTAEIEEYIKTVDKLYAHAIATSLVEHSDCTNMLENPSFASGDFTGWTIKSGTGKLGNKNVECFQTEVDIKQVVKDVPNGIYSVSVQAFERPGGNGSFDGSEEAKVFLFMNQFQTPVQNICSDVVAVENAVPASFDASGNVIYDGSGNCYLDQNGAASAWPYDYEVSGQGYIPNSVDGARIAFEADRYVQKCYGIVENGEMTIGLTSNGKKIEWVLWANFHLTYEGKSAEALAELLPTYVEELQAYIDEHELSDPGKAAAEKAVADAEKAIKDADADAMWNALLATNAALVAAKENYEAAENCFNASIELEEAISEFEETASDEAKNNAAAVAQKAGNYSSLTTEELLALTEEIKDAAAALRVPQTDGATFENFVDMTSVIVNPDMETGNANGWTLTVGAQNLGFQNNTTYSNGEDPEVGVISNFIEGWKPGAILDNGEISQVIKSLPAGAYALEADIIASWQDDASREVEGVYLFAQEGDGAWQCVPLATGNGVPQHFINYFVKKSADTPLNIGVGVKDANANWLAADNFTMKYFGSADQEAFIEVGVKNIDAAPAKANGKFFQNGQIFIMKNGVKYNVAGQKLR